MPAPKMYDKSMVGDKKICGICRQPKDLMEFWKEGHGRMDKDTRSIIRRWYCSECGNKINNGVISKKEVETYKSEFRIWMEQQTVKEKLNDIDQSTLISALIELSRHNIQRLHAISEKDFIARTNSQKIVENFDFAELKKIAEQELYNLGLHRPADVQYGPGRYLIIGDTHGTHTKTIMFDLLKNMNKKLKFKKIIHVGHILDDDNVINYYWKDFKNIVVLARTEEARHLENGIKVEGHNYDIVRNSMYLGKLTVSNQELLTDYIKFGIENLDSRIFKSSTICNSHKHELETRCTYGERKIFASPGCLCEQHIVKTIKQIDFTSGYQVKIAYPSSFIKYRKMSQLVELWEQGMAIVEVSESGEFTITMCRVKRIGDEYATSYFDKIYHGNKVVNPENKIIVNSDLHIPKHSTAALEVQDLICKDYKPDMLINLGDIQSCDSLNHHKMSRGEPTGSSFSHEISSMNWVLKQMAKWAPERYLMLGNHERFIRDFYRRFPQLESVLNEALYASIENEGYKVFKLKDVLSIGDVKFIHGDFKMYGQKGGSFLVKVANTFKPPVMVGHLHYVGIKSGSYMVGFSGEFDQDYNEVNASSWMHGFGLCNQYKGVSFVTTIPIFNGKVMMNNKKYASKKLDFWKMPKYNIKMQFEFTK